MKKKISELLKQKMLIFKVIIIILVILSLLLVLINKKVSNLEKLKINEFNEDVVTYLDEIYETDDEGKYITFAIRYLNEKENKTNFTDQEIIDTINNIFNINYSINNLEKIGISKNMAELGITHDINSFNYNNVQTKKDIADTVIYKYDLNSIKKKNKNKFVIKYDRLIVENPYEVLNYYSEKNKDISEIKKYLDGEGSIKNIKKYIRIDNIDKVGKKSGKIKITYIIKNDKLLIDNIE